MRGSIVACCLVLVGLSPPSAQAGSTSGVVGSGVLCVVVNLQCVPVGAFAVSAVSPATGQVIYSHVTGGSITILLDCVDINLASEVYPGSPDGMDASGRDAAGVRWWVRVLQFRSGRVRFSVWQQEPGDGTCGFGEGLVPSAGLAQGRFIFARA